MSKGLVPTTGLIALINGYSYYEFTSYHVHRSIEDLAGQFRITMSAFWWNNRDANVQTQIDLFPDIKIGDKVQILVNSTPVLTGYIEKMDVAYSNSHHEITIQGRDKVADLIDSTIGEKMELTGPLTFTEVLQQVLETTNMTDVKVLDHSGGMTPFQPGEIVNGNINQTAFSFIEHYARQRQVMLTTDGLGNIVIARQSAVKALSSLLHLVNYNEISLYTKANTGISKKYANKLDGETNTILDASIHWDYTKCFYLYRVNSQTNPSADKTLSSDLGSSADNKKVASPYHGEATDPNMRRKTRVLDIVAEQSIDESILVKRAEWEAKIRRARAFNYSCKVWGHTMGTSKLPWTPNMKVRVVDSFADIDNYFVIKSVTFEYSLSAGTITTIDVVELDSYIPEPLVTQSELHTRHHGKGKTNKGEVEAPF